MPGLPSDLRMSSSRTVIHWLAYTCLEACCSTTAILPESAISYPDSVRLVIARCQVDYVGRLTAHLPMAQRLLLVKADGSVSVHSDDRAYKPLNWMSPPCWLIDDGDVWTVQNKAGEKLVISMAEILHDSARELGAA